jgi:hypothetical protein
MSEKDNNFSFKNYVTLKEYLESRLENIEKSTDLAARIMEKRLEGMNEFRETLKDQASQFVTRTELIVIQKAIEKDIRELRDFKATIEGKASQLSVIIATALSILGLFLAVISFFL